MNAKLAFALGGAMLATRMAAASSSCPADINNTNTVDVNDLLGVINGWGACQTIACPADINHDWYVNVSDLLGVINAWGPCTIQLDDCTDPCPPADSLHWCIYQITAIHSQNSPLLVGEEFCVQCPVYANQPPPCPAALFSIPTDPPTLCNAVGEYQQCVTCPASLAKYKRFQSK